MSHFTVLVVTDTPDQVGATLQPFHEYECTGIEDQYVVNVDRTGEVEEWLKRELFVGLSRAKGSLDYQYHKERAEELLCDFKTMTQEEYIVLKGQNISDEIREWFGYEFKNDKWMQYTNPNAKWDWWQIGGRWSGLLKPKDPAIGEKGSTGLMGSEYAPEGVDQCIKSNVDFDGRMKGAADDAATDYDKAAEIIAGREFKTWDQCREEAETLDAARETYSAQDVIKDLKKVYDNPFVDLFSYAMDRQKFIDTAANSAISTFAVLKDGKWYEKGEMGWFACVGNEKEQADWNGELKALLDTIPDDKCLTIVDCHI